jgi:hypothetical protein
VAVEADQLGMVIALNKPLVKIGFTLTKKVGGGGDGEGGGGDGEGGGGASVGVW